MYVVFNFNVNSIALSIVTEFILITVNYFGLYGFQVAYMICKNRYINIILPFSYH